MGWIDLIGLWALRIFGCAVAVLLLMLAINEIYQRWGFTKRAVLWMARDLKFYESDVRPLLYSLRVHRLNHHCRLVIRDDETGDILPLMDQPVNAPRLTEPTPDAGAREGREP